MINILPFPFKELPVFFHSLCSKYSQENINRPVGFHKEHILLVRSGKGVLNYNGKVYPLEKDCAFYIQKNIPHSYHNIENLCTAWLTFDGPSVQTLLKYYGIQHFYYNDKMNTPELISILEKITDEYFFQKRQSVMSALVYQFLISFFDNSLPVELSAIEKSNLFIEQNFNEKITLENLVSVSGYSKSKFCYAYKKKYGMTAFEKIKDLRLNCARSILLMNPDIKIKDLSHQCGFEDESYFCSAYKKKYGHSPKKQ